MANLDSDRMASNIRLNLVGAMTLISQIEELMSRPQTDELLMDTERLFGECRTKIAQAHDQVIRWEDAFVEGTATAPTPDSVPVEEPPSG